MKKWILLYYETTNGKSPIYEFIEGLDVKAKAKIIKSFTLLEDFGVQLGMPHIKKITGTDLWELRILGGDSIRVLYVAITGRTFLLLHGFVKKKMETPKKEINTAINRLQEYKQRSDM